VSLSCNHCTKNMASPRISSSEQCIMLYTFSHTSVARSQSVGISTFMWTKTLSFNSFFASGLFTIQSLGHKSWHVVIKPSQGSKNVVYVKQVHKEQPAYIKNRKHACMVWLLSSGIFREYQYIEMYKPCYSALSHIVHYIITCNSAVLITPLSLPQKGQRQ